MRKWRFTLASGKALRAAITDGDVDLESCKATMDALIVCYKEIMSRISDIEIDISEAYADVVSCRKIMDINDDATREDTFLERGFYDLNQPLECTNINLETFYNICDDYSIFVAL